MDDSRRQAAEALKDLLMERKKSRWPMVLGAAVLLILLAAGGVWLYLPADQRPQFDAVAGRAATLAKNLLNAPIMSAPVTPSTPASPASSAPGSPPASTPPDDNTLLSK